MRRAIVSAVVAIMVLAGTPVALYSLADPEKLDLDESVRRATPGQFVRLTDGYTHYEIGGPPASHVVVLAAGFSVPYYIWDPTSGADRRPDSVPLRLLQPRLFRPADVPRRRFTSGGSRNSTASDHRLIDLVGLSLGGAVVTGLPDTT